MKILLTGAAGFIGSTTAHRLLARGDQVVGLDNLNDYYDVRLKQDRLARLTPHPAFRFVKMDVADRAGTEKLFAEERFDRVIHLAAQAGVRYSLENPRAYIDANLIGTFNVMELVRMRPVRHFMLASTSSAYGANTSMPFHETDRADHPLTLYAATKKAGELMAHSYSHLWNIPTTAFRFFSVYGTWGRPDMALFKFTKGIIEGTPIDIYNHGQMERDFTYVDDLVEAIVRLIGCVPMRPDGAPEAGESLSPAAPFRLVNIGGGAPSGLLEFIEEIEKSVGKKAIRNYMPMQPGDVTRTFANAALLEKLTGFRPATPVATGVKAFVDWYRAYFSV